MRASYSKSSLSRRGTREGISKSICTNLSLQTGIARNQPRYSSTGMGQSIMLDYFAAPKTYDLLTALDLSYLHSAKIENSVLLSLLAPSVWCSMPITANPQNTHSPQLSKMPRTSLVFSLQILINMIYPTSFLAASLQVAISLSSQRLLW